MPCAYERGCIFINMQNKKEKTKEEVIAQTYRKLKKFFKFLDKDRLEFADKLCKKAAFMDVMLDEMQDKVTREGTVITAINGNGFEVQMDNPAIKAYNVMFKNYSVAMKQLIELLPQGTEEADELMMFVKGKKK